MTKARAQDIIDRLASFQKLEDSRKATDEVGWIALTYSVSRDQAAQLIEEAHTVAEQERPS